MPTRPFDRLPDAPQSEAHEPPVESLARIAANLKTIADALAEYPARHPVAWSSPEWAKDLKDLRIACGHLLEYARRAEDLATRLAKCSDEPQ